MLGFAIVVALAILAPSIIGTFTGGGRYPDTQAGRDQKAKDAVFTYWVLIGAGVLVGGLLFLGNVLVALVGVAMLVMGIKSHSGGK